MSNEIKEILDKLDFNEWEVDLYKVPITWCELYGIRDYITNLQEEADRLNNIINETRRILGQYAHYLTPTEEQNAKNEAIVDEAYNQLHGNIAKELKENK